MSHSARVAFFLPGLHVGGAERVVLSLAAQFSAWGLPCDIVCAQSGTAWTDRIPAGVRLVELGSRRPLSAILPLWKYLRATRPQTLLSTITSANIAALVACRLPGVRTRCYVREANFIEADLAGGPIKRRLTTLALRALYPSAAGVIALSAGMARHLSDFLGIARDRLTVIANPAPAAPGPGVEPAVLSEPSPPTIVACGRLTPQKDFSTLLKALSTVARSMPCRLRLFGTGPLEADLTQQADELGISSLVTFEGYSDDPFPAIQAADLFVLSSRWEGFPNVLTEALAASTPIVATDCSDAVHEILDGSRLGTIVPVGDSSAMASAILDIIEGRMTFPSAGSHLAQYSLEAIALKYRELMFPES